MDDYGCFGSVLSRDPERNSCSSCNLFQDCGVEVERVRAALIIKWNASKELKSLALAFKKARGETIIEALEEITEVFGDADLSAYDKMRIISARCPNNRSVRNLERWHGWGVDLQKIRRGENSFRKEAEPFAHLFVEELIARKAADDDFYASIQKQMNYKPAATIAQINTMVQALYAASVLEKRDGVYTLRELS